MKTSVQRWGNSLALRIPRAFAAETQLRDGSQVELTLHEGAMVVRPVRRGKLLLNDLLSKISDGNQHGEVTTGDAVGREVW